MIEGEGISSILGAVTTSVSITAYDEAGILNSQGGDIYFLHVENVCHVTDNYRCDQSRDHS